MRKRKVLRDKGLVSIEETDTLWLLGINSREHFDNARQISLGRVKDGRRDSVKFLSRSEGKSVRWKCTKEK